MRSRRLIAFSLSVSLMLASVACNALVGFGGLERVDGELTPDGSTELDDARPRRDGSTTDDAGEEPDSATTTLKRCNPNMPFGAPTRVEEFVDPIDSASAVLRADELEAYFVSFSGGTLKQAKRATRDAAWQVGSVTLSKTGTPISLSSDGLKLYLVDETGGIAFLSATRPTTQQNFSTASSMTVGSSVASSTLWVTDAADKAYFSRKAGSDALIAFAALEDNTLSSTSSQVDGLQHVAGKHDDVPVLNRAETVIYFYSDRPGKRAWRAQRATKNAAFSAPEEVAAFDGNFDMVTWVSDDDCLVYLDRERFVWRAVRPK